MADFSHPRAVHDLRAGVIWTRIMSNNEATKRRAGNGEERSDSSKPILPALTLGLLVLGYGHFLLDSAFPRSSTPAVDVFFEPEENSALLLVGVAAWMLWRRRALLFLGKAVGHRGGVASLLTLALCAHIWAQFSATPSLFVISLAANLLALFAWCGGSAAVRAGLLPICVLLFAIPLPATLSNEWLWTLQVFSATGTARLLEVLGFAPSLQGIQLTLHEMDFLIIEACSGFRAMRTMLIAALVIRELRGLRGPRSWLLVAGALPVALSLNLLRIGAIMLAGDPSALSDPRGHVMQGAAVLLAGTVLLFVVGHWLERGNSVLAPPGLALSTLSSRVPWRFAAGWLSVLALATWLVPSRQLPPAPGPELADWPLVRKAWRGEMRRPDRMFLGRLSLGQILDIRYRRAGRANEDLARVDLFVGVESGGQGGSPRSSKLGIPGRDWNEVSRGQTRLAPLFLDVESVVAERGGHAVLSYFWVLRDAGTIGEAARDLLGLQGPLPRERPRVAVRLTTPIPEGPEGMDWARSSLNHFTNAFHPYLSRL